MDYTAQNAAERDALERLSAQYLREYLQSSRGIDRRAAVIQCPNAREHAHGDKNKSAKVYANGVHCFTCGRTFRLIDLIALDKGLRPYSREAYDELRKFVGYHTERCSETVQAAPERCQQPEPEAVKALPAADLTGYFLQCAERARSGSGAEYLRRRGLTAETCARFLIGFDPAHIATNADGQQWGEPEPRIIIPTSRTTYKARRTYSKPDASGKDRFKALSQPGGAPSLFFRGAAALRDGKPVFVCEGEFDALSILQTGGESLALSGAANIQTLLDLIREQVREHSRLILMLDADEAGQKKAAELYAGIGRMRSAGLIPPLAVHIFREYPEGCKDPNDILKQGPERLAEIVNQYEKPVDAILRRALWAGVVIEELNRKQVTRK